MPLTAALTAFGLSVLAYAHLDAQISHASAAASASAPLHLGDSLRVRIWREPELSRVYGLQEDGTVEFPRVGRIAVTRLPIDSLRSMLTTRYGEVLRDPVVEVTPLRRIGVQGAVRAPGYYYADPTITVVGALILAGGVTPVGTDKRIDLLRNGEQMRLDRADGAFRDDTPVQSGDLITVPERSWASRNVAVVTSIVTAVALVVAALVR